ncbi:MAG: VWA domain-containing protein [Candidatus Methanomethylophilus sp.]|jgi:magnesium chelatase subunit D|nr:VWA domain-containing protein [Methanomethylophilus sp.]MCI2093454.1 VWA domain-containing protein [Methanomethylophilus sp.]
MSPGPLKYPFSAVSGETAAKRALMCLLADDSLCGVLIKGPSGTAKSVLVRSLSGISGRDIVNLPAGAGDEDIFGGMDLEKAIGDGRTDLKEGILGRADGNILCIDNINLLDTRTADAVMGAVESGRVEVEREGVSAEYPLRTSVVATMNPAEKDLPDSVADRFEICISTLADSDAQTRADIIESDLAFREDPEGFAFRFSEDDRRTAERIARARELIPGIKITRRDIYDIVTVCKKMNAVGHRGDIACARVARDLAALDGRDRITADDIRDASVMCLLHRRNPKLPAVGKRELGLGGDDSDDAAPDADDDEQEISAEEIAEVARMEKSGELDTDSEEILKEAEEEAIKADGDGSKPEKESSDEEEDDDGPIPDVDVMTLLLDDVQNNLAEIDRIETISLRNVVGQIPRGAESGDRNGRAHGFRIPEGKTSDPAIVPTIRAAAPHQKTRKPNGLSVVIENRDIRENIRIRQSVCSFMFAVDVSGSLDNTGMLEEAMKAVRAMLEDGYVRRDRVALLTFGQHLVNLAVPFTRNVEAIFDALSKTVTGGSTPLGQAMMTLDKYMRNYTRKNPEQKCYVIMITDGSPDIPALKGEPWAELKKIVATIKVPNTEWVIIDNGPRHRRINYAQKLADMLKGRYIYIDDLTGRFEEEE